MSQDHESGLRALIGRTIGRDLASIGLDEDLVDVFGLDSLDALRLLAAAEKHYGIRFADDQLSELRTLRKILRAVDGKAVEGASGGRP